MSSVPFQSALSLLSAMASASQHPAFQTLQKAPPTTSSMPVTVASAPTQAPAPPLPPAPAPPLPPAAPVNLGTVPASNASGPSIGTPGSSPPSTSMHNLCESCHVRPKYSDGTKTHPFCSKGCAAKKNKTIGTANGTSNAASAGTCDYCHNRPKYSDGTRTHSFCSKSCAKNSKAGGTPQRQGSAINKGSSPTVCQVPGCQNPPHKNTNGTPSEYCSIAHKTFAESACLMCHKASKQGDRHFCGKACAEEAEKKGPMILEVPAGHVTFKSVADQFKASWRHTGSTAPAVKGVYKIVGSQQSVAQYDAYRATVEVRGQFANAGRSIGNENRRWHGTRRECNLGDSGQTQFCSSTTCSLCCIVRTSFDLSLFGKKTGWGRFGVGIYTSSTSSKSNDYAHNKSTSSLKAMLLNKVVVGKGYKMTHDNTSLAAPPAGFDSVLAEKGGSLNYDELVVYTNDAIRPSFLVMYDA